MASKAAPGALEALLDWGRTEMTMYLPTGKKKHARWFWIDAETKKLCWSKTQDGKANKSEPLISVLDEIKVPSAKELFDEVDDDKPLAAHVSIDHVLQVTRCIVGGSVDAVLVPLALA